MQPHRWFAWCALLALQIAALRLAALSQGAGAVEVGPNVRVSPASFQRPLTEPYVTAHPRNPKHLIAVAISASVTAEASRTEQPCVAMFTEDGGMTWSQPHTFAIASCADPWVALRGDGVAVFTALDRGTMQVFRSEDGGRNWSAVTLPPGFSTAHDRSMVEVDHASGAFYLVSLQAGRSATRQSIARVHVARSTDAGKTFELPMTVQPSNLNFNVFSAAVLTDGKLVISFADFQSNVDGFRDKGMLERKRAWALVSSDGAKTFSPPLFVAEDCGGDIAADRSPGGRDRLYFLCRTRGDVLVRVSADAGERWSEPVRTNSRGAEFGMPHTASIVVNSDGIVGASWYERTKDRACQHVYFATSLDGGKTFLPETRVSNAESCPENSRNGRAAQRWPFGGDYSGLTAAADGTFHVLWADSRESVYQLYTAKVKVAPK